MADARNSDLRKKLCEVQDEINFAKETSFEETEFCLPSRAALPLEKGNVGSNPVGEEGKPATPLTTPTTARPPVGTNSGSVPSPSNQTTQTIPGEVAKATVSSTIQYGASATSIASVSAPATNMSTQIAEQIEKQEPTLAQKIKVPGNGKEMTIFLDTPNAPSPFNPKSQQRLNDRPLPPVPVAPIPPLRQSVKGVPNGHKYTQSMNDFDPLRNSMTTAMYLQNDTIVPVVSIPTSMAMDPYPFKVVPPIGSVPLVAEVDGSVKSQSHFILPASFEVLPGVMDSGTATDQHTTSLATGQSSLVNGFHGFQQQQQQQFVAVQQQPIMLQHVPGGMQPFVGSGQWAQAYTNQPFAYTQGAIHQHQHASTLGHPLPQQQLVQHNNPQQQQPVQNINQLQMQNHKHTKSAL